MPMRFLAVAVLLALMAFFAAGEFALIPLRPSRVQQLLESGEPGARSIARLQQASGTILESKGFSFDEAGSWGAPR